MWEKEYEDYKLNGLQEQCPADPGPERSEWQNKRLYFACRQMAELMDSDADPMLLSKAATAVCIATRQPGWAAFENAFTEALRTILERAAEHHGVYESELTNFDVQVRVDWANEGVFYSETRHVNYPNRLREKSASTIVPNLIWIHDQEDRWKAEVTEGPIPATLVVWGPKQNGSFEYEVWANGDGEPDLMGEKPSLIEAKLQSWNAFCTLLPKE